jgi:hypothetical protein
MNFTRRIAPVAAVVLLVACSGCYTNDAARKRATDLAVDLDAYRSDQVKRLDDINRQYRFDYARLIAEVTRLRLNQFEQFLDLDVMEAAGELLTEWERETLPRKIRDRFADTLDRRRVRLLEVDKQIDDARAAYADAYQAVQLNLSQLKAAQESVVTLAAPEDQRRTIANFVVTVGKIVNDLHEQAKKDQQATGTP